MVWKEYDWGWKAYSKNGRAWRLWHGWNEHDHRWHNAPSSPYLVERFSVIRGTLAKVKGECERCEDQVSGAEIIA